MIVVPKDGADESELEPAVAGVPSLWSAWALLRTVPKLPLLGMVLLFVGLEVAAIRLTQWTASRTDAESFEQQRAELQGNLTALDRLQRASVARLALAEADLHLREQECGRLRSRVQVLEEANARLRANSTALGEESRAALAELAADRLQFGLARNELRGLQESNLALHKNLTALEEERKLLQEDLDLRYNQSLEMSSKVQRLEEENLVLITSLASLRREEQQAEAEAEGNLTQLLEQRSAMRRNLTRLRRTVRDDAVERTFARQELDLRYQEFIDLRKDDKELAAENKALRANITAAQHLGQANGTAYVS